jgi:hypothetical protein
MKHPITLSSLAQIRLCARSLALGALVAGVVRPAGAQGKLRGEVEAERVRVEGAYRAAPNNPPVRRAYAAVLFQLGDVRQAQDVIAPLATPASSDTADLALGARLALLTSDYGRAEALYRRLKGVAPEGSKTRIAALEGLTMVYYQTNQYAKAKRIELPDEETEERGLGNLLTFMKRFEGTPYRIEWSTPEKVAQLPIVNDFTPGGALPIMDLEINGRPVHFILDTGGDRLYLDEGVAGALGIRTISKRRTKYAYTHGEYVEEPLGVADAVKMGEVTLRNVPVVVAKWKALGQTTDGVVTTQMLKQFLSTVDYDQKRITLRERSTRGKAQLTGSFGGQAPIAMPFFMSDTHLMFAQGSLNGHPGMNLLLDSGLAASVPIVILDETVEFLGLTKTPLQGSKYYLASLTSHGLGDMTRGATQALGNVMVEENAYRSHGFLFDALISHQYLRHLGSWTIDFDAMRYYFPASARAEAKGGPTQ